MRRFECLLVVLSFFALLLFVTIGIYRPIWLDEANSILVASQSFSGIVDKLRHENNLPVYYFFLALWMRVFGDSEAATHALSGLFYICGTVTTFLLGLSLFRDRRTAYYCAFFYLASTQAIRQAQTVRMYSFLGFLAAFSLLAFFKLFQRGSRRRWAWMLYCVVNAMGLLTHVWFFFLLAAQMVALVLWLPRVTRKQFFLTMLVSSLPFLGLWSPFFIEQLSNGATSWMPRFDLRFVTNTLFEFYGGSRVGPLFYGAYTILVLLGDRQHLKRFLTGETARILLTLCVVALATPLLVSVLKPIYWPGRYTIIGLAPLAVFLGATVAQSAPRPPLMLLCTAVLLTLTAVQIMTREYNWEFETPAEQSDRATTQYLVQHAAPGDVLLFTSLSRAAVDYYLHRFHMEGRFIELSFPDEISTHLSWRDNAAVLQRRDSLELEANGVVAMLENLLREDGRRIWLLYGADREVSDILKDKLDQHFVLQSQPPRGGSFYRWLLVYSSP